MDTIDEVKEIVRKKYGGEINVDEIAYNLSLDVFNSMNLVFCYGNPDKYHPNEDEIEADMVSLIPEIISIHIDDKEELLNNLQNPGDDKMRRDEYLHLLSGEQLSILKDITLLFRMFETIKEVNKDDYPDWIDWWQECFDLDINARYEQNKIADESLFNQNLDSISLVGDIITCLHLRCIEILTGEIANGNKDEKKIKQIYNLIRIYYEQISEEENGNLIVDTLMEFREASNKFRSRQLKKEKDANRMSLVMGIGCHLWKEDEASGCYETEAERFYYKAKQQTEHLTKGQIQTLLAKKTQERAKTIQEVANQNGIHEDTSPSNFFAGSEVTLESHNIRKDASTQAKFPIFTRIPPEILGEVNYVKEYDIVKVTMVEPKMVNKALREKGMLGI